MTRAKPSQERSRDRVEQILLAAEALIREADGLDDLTTSAISMRAEISVATVYRYFEDRYEIVLALLEREIETLDELIEDSISELEIVTVYSLMQGLLMAHFAHYESNRLTSILWFSARDHAAVRDRIARHYRERINWLIQGWIGSGLLKADFPDWVGEAAVWLADQSFELMFRDERPTEERQAIMRGFVAMLGDQLAKFETPEGADGIPVDEFLAIAGSLRGTEVDAR